MSEGTGWVGDIEGNYNVHANAKLTLEQKEAIAASGESESQWIREAVEERLERERTRHGPLERTSTVHDIDRAILYLKLKKRMIELTQEKESSKLEKKNNIATGLNEYEEAIGIKDMGDKPYLSDDEKRTRLRAKLKEYQEKG